MNPKWILEEPVSFTCTIVGSLIGVLLFSLDHTFSLLSVLVSWLLAIGVIYIVLAFIFKKPAKPVIGKESTSKPVSLSLLMLPAVVFFVCSIGLIILFNIQAA